MILHKSLVRKRRPYVTIGASSLRQLNGLGCKIFIRDLLKQIANAIQPSPPLVVRVHDEPRRLLDIGMGEHAVFGPRVIGPKPSGFQIHRR